MHEADPLAVLVGELVDVVQATADVAGQVEQCGRRDRPGLGEPRGALATDEVHHQEPPTVVAAELLRAHDVGMRDEPAETGFA